MTRPPWWRPDVHADRRPFLLGRSRIQAALRRRLENEGFVEVDPSILQVSPGNEAHLHAFATEALAVDGTPAGRLYLHTSPEFACKKLLAAGERRLFTFAHVFRNRERGARHHPEFTMLEWYRAGEPYETTIADAVAFLAEAAEAAGAARLVAGGIEVDPQAEPERVTLAEAFDRFAGIDLLGTVGSGGETDREALAAALRDAKIRVAEDDTWADLFSRVLVERIEPQLGRGRATVLCTDPVEQRRRFVAEMAEKERVYGERYPLDEDFLAALALMPPASGVAMGFDRLVMLATGASRIEQVLWAPVATG